MIREIYVKDVPSEVSLRGVGIFAFGAAGDVLVNIQ
jgi:hypothetical protein